MEKPKRLQFTGGFLMLPHELLNSPKFRNLSASAVKLLLDIAGQYSGKNNGDLSAAWKVMQPKGWRSEATLDRAKKELLKTGFIAETRKGRRPNLCSLYGVTWQFLNPNPKLDIGPEAFPVGAWIELPKVPPCRASLTTVSVVGKTAIATDSVVIQSPIATKTVAMRPEKACLMTTETVVLYRSKPLHGGYTPEAGQ